MKIIPIYQTYGNKLEYFTVSNGDKAGFEAVLAAIQLGIPNGSTIYFAVDYDVQDGHIKNQVIPYFRVATIANCHHIYIIEVHRVRHNVWPDSISGAVHKNGSMEATSTCYLRQANVALIGLVLLVCAEYQCER